MPILAIYGIIAAVLVAIGGGIGWKVTSNHYEAKENKESKVALSVYQDKVIELAELGTKYEAAKSEQRIVYRTIEKKIPEIVERPVYRNECIDSDGLRYINEALTGKLSDSGEHVNGVSDANPVRGQDGS